MRSERKQNSEHGFWKATGEACEIFTNSSLIGWRTTLEFYKGQAPHGRKTNWVMQEYKITEKSLHINSNSKVSHATCYLYSFFPDNFLLFSSSIQPASQLPIWLDQYAGIQFAMQSLSYQWDRSKSRRAKQTGWCRNCLGQWLSSKVIITCSKH